MKACLISAATATEFQNRQLSRSNAVRAIVEHPPAGILVLAAILEETGFAVSVVDLNRTYLSYLRGNGHRAGLPDFVAHAGQMLASASADVFGFGTLCSSYSLTLRIAQQLRRARPDAPIILGGPHASVVDIATLEAFPFVDFIVRGEAEETLPQLLNAVGRGAQPDGIRGVTFRYKGNLRRNPDAPVINDLDRIPAPAYQHWPFLEGWQEIPLEFGRGCPFGCTFCSTNDFFRRRYRTKSPGVLLQQMKSIRERYGIKSFNLIHDSFTADRRRVVEFCEAMTASGEDFSWCSSARTDCLDDDLIRRMARSRCRGVFVGIETGSPGLQKAIRKNLDLSDARRKIRRLVESGIGCMVSLIIGFPGETVASLNQTVAFLVDSLRHEKVETQLHLLAPLPGTPIHNHYRDLLQLDEAFSDISSQGGKRDSADLAMIRSHPGLFPNYYYIPVPNLNRRQMVEFREFVAALMSGYRWLFIALHQDARGSLSVFHAWKSWHEAQGRVGRRAIRRPGNYYAGRFWEDFLHFLVSDYIPGRGRNALPLKALAECEVRKRELRKLKVKKGAPLPSELRFTDVPVLADGVMTFEVGVDLKKLLACLASKNRLSRVPRRATMIALRAIPGTIERLQITPDSARLIRLCNGTRNLRQVVRAFAARRRTLAGVSASRAGLYGVMSLIEQGLLTVGVGVVPREAVCHSGDSIGKG